VVDLVALVLLLLFGLAGCAESHAQTLPPPARPAFARAASAVHHWSAADRDSVRGVIADVFSAPAVDGVSGVAVVADDGTPLVDLHGDRAMTPASTMKLLVGSTTFFLFGADRRLETAFESTRLPGHDGELDNLWLVGGGDPVLTSDDLVRGIAALRRAGVRSVHDLIVDASAFSGPEQNPHWSRDDDQYDYAAGTSAISLDWNVVKTVIDGAQVYRPVTHIPAYVADVTRTMLEHAGIGVGPVVRIDTSPLVATTLWLHRSPPIGDLIEQMFRESDNHIAEQLLRVLGAADSIGTVNAGARIEREFLSEVRVPQSGLRIIDASGLADSNRVSPMTLATLLVSDAALKGGQAFIRTLPRAGIEGTVRYHQLSEAAGRVRAKSGHIDGVNALAGYVQTRNHGRIAFAFVVNEPGLDDGAVESTYDRALDRLSEF
jgi:D-alanyl-D-alanine carboxypeptidase/D-alanyl-D-alanine-endopeptidase (penicillin-binding protein 4)